MENTNGSYKSRHLRLANELRIVPWGTHMVLPRIQRHRRTILHWSAHPQRVQNETKKSTYSVDWQHQGIGYGPTRLPQNVQDIRSHKFYRENHVNLESEIDSRRERLRRSGNPKRYIPGRCTITIIICNSDDVTQQYTHEMRLCIQT